ncbi:unnamed protein product [Ectocarpus sp. 12 AP-2014]
MIQTQTCTYRRIFGYNSSGCNNIWDRSSESVGGGAAEAFCVSCCVSVCVHASRHWNT